MAQPPQTGGEMRALYLVFRRWELAPASPCSPQASQTGKSVNRWHRLRSVASERSACVPRPVIPENPNLLPALTFSSYARTLAQCMFAPADALLEASNATTRHHCSARLRHLFLPITGLTIPRKSRATASAR